jgi:putative heme iron utilization protein
MLLYMSKEAPRTARRILEGQRLAALGTLHAGEPSVSMVPFATTSRGALVIHVSALSSHTADMRAHPRVSVLVVDADQQEEMPQAVARVTIQGDAEQLDSDTSEYGEARNAYQSRFPEATPIIELGGFSLFVIRPRTVRVIGGFGSATTITAEDFAEAMA